MCKTILKTNLYYVNLFKLENEKNMTRLWFKIMPKTSGGQIEGNERSLFYLYPFQDLAQGCFQEGFYVCIEQINFLKTFIIENQL